MKISEIVFSDEQRKQLRTLMKTKSLPLQVVKRLEAIRLLEKGCTPTMVAHQLAIRKELVRKYATDFLKKGFDGLVRLEKPGKDTILTEEKFQALESYIQQQKKLNKRCSLKDLTTFLTVTFGITMSAEWLSKRLVLRKQAQKQSRSRINRDILAGV